MMSASSHNRTASVAASNPSRGGSGDTARTTISKSPTKASMSKPKVARGGVHVPRKAKSSRKASVIAAPAWQATGANPGAIRGMRPDITPVANPKLYKFRDCEPSSKNWKLNKGDDLAVDPSTIVDSTPVGNSRFHRFRDANPMSKGWHLSNGDELIKSEMTLDTTPLQHNIKTHRFRDNQAGRHYYSVPKSVKPVLAYFDG